MFIIWLLFTFPVKYRAAFFFAESDTTPFLFSRFMVSGFRSQIARESCEFLVELISNVCLLCFLFFFVCSGLYLERSYKCIFINGYISIKQLLLYFALFAHLVQPPV